MISGQRSASWAPEALLLNAWASHIVTPHFAYRTLQSNSGQVNDNKQVDG